MRQGSPDTRSVQACCAKCIDKRLAALTYVVDDARQETTYLPDAFEKTVHCLVHLEPGIRRRFGFLIVPVEQDMRRHHEFGKVVQEQPMSIILEIIANVRLQQTSNVNARRGLSRNQLPDRYLVSSALDCCSANSQPYP